MKVRLKKKQCRDGLVSFEFREQYIYYSLQLKNICSLRIINSMEWFIYLFQFDDDKKKSP